MLRLYKETYSSSLFGAIGYTQDPWLSNFRILVLTYN
jgi:hypothetical protein